MQIRSATDLVVYKKAYHLAMEIFQLSKTWSKRRYEAHFLSKLADSDGENSETDTRLDFARDCGFLASDDHARLAAECRQAGAMLGSMIKNPSPFLIRPAASDL
jgi:hypothetical protein